MLAAPAASFPVDEFGVPASLTGQGHRKYAFRGSKQRESLIYGHAISMGVRTYSPYTGRFLQPDPVLGGSASTYDYANQDPVNQYDLSGECPICVGVAIRVVVGVVARAAVAAGAAVLSRGAAVALSRAVARAPRAGSAAYKKDLYHAAAGRLTRRQLMKGKAFKFKGGDGRDYRLLQVRGRLDGKLGVFEYIYDPRKRVVTHQLFKAGRKIDGKIN